MTSKKYCIKFLGVELEYKKDLFYPFDITSGNFIDILNNAIRIIKNGKLPHSNFVLSVENDNECFYRHDTLSINLGYKNLWTFKAVKNIHCCLAKFSYEIRLFDTQSRYGKMKNSNSHYLYFNTLQIPDILEVVSYNKNEITERLKEIKKPKLAKPEWVLM